MKKRILAALAAAAAALSLLSACGEGVVDPNATSNQSAVSEAVSSALQESDVEDSLSGLESYMLSQGYISGAAAQMNGSLIGALEEGHRYVANGVTAEFYQYDLENLSDTANAVRASVEENGTFEIVGQTISGVYLSDSGKYLMIYQNSAADEESQAKTQAAIEAFQSFKSE